MPKVRTIGAFRMFDPEKSFFSLWIVWLVFAVAGTLIFWSTQSILNNSELIPDLSHKGWNNLFEYFKFPIWVAAALIPIVTVLAVNHKSHQHIHNMELTRTQNIFANYYKHLEEFKRHVFETVLVKHKSLLVNIDDIRRLHRIVFEDAENGIYQSSQNFRDSLLRDIKEFVSSIFGNNLQTETDISNFVGVVYSIKSDFEHHFGYTVKASEIGKKQGATIEFDSIKFFVPNQSISLLLQHELQIMMLYIEILSFDASTGDYDLLRHFEHIVGEFSSALPTTNMLRSTMRIGAPPAEFATSREKLSRLILLIERRLITGKPISRRNIRRITHGWEPV